MTSRKAEQLEAIMMNPIIVSTKIYTSGSPSGVRSHFLKRFAGLIPLSVDMLSGMTYIVFIEIENTCSYIKLTVDSFIFEWNLISRIFGSSRKLIPAISRKFAMVSNGEKDLCNENSEN